MTHIENRKIQPPNCYHCGLPCKENDILFDNKHFCCRGCQTVYEILSENDLCQYYQLNASPGQSPTESKNVPRRFEYLEDENVQNQLLSFNNGKVARVTFNIPGMHCSSCIWLLEHLYQLNEGITESRVNFLRKELSLVFNPQKTTLRQIVELLTSLGYEPHISLEDLQKKSQKATDRSLYIKLGVAGFAFGNVMLLSFPEYFSVKDTLDFQFRQFFGILNILLSLPVLLYSASEFLSSAFKGLKYKTVNIDVPISLGIITLFGRSIYEILAGHGSGYMDSFVGLVFLLLLGKLFQKKTYETLSFDRDYKSYFPVAITRREGSTQKTVPLNKIQVGDRLIIRHQELIPADSILINGIGYIDYSFVTGESSPEECSSGDMIYAGGKQMGSTIEVEVIKEVSQSYLTQLWNDEAFQKTKEARITTLANTIAKYFTLIVLSIAAIAFFYWLPTDIALAINAFTAVLIIACPCALALSTPFTLGNVLRIWGKNQFYLKNTTVIEALSQITTVVFDKTGTLTMSGQASVNFVPINGFSELTADQVRLIKSALTHSTHPLSQAIIHSLNGTPEIPVTSFSEVLGQGVEAYIDGHHLKIGSAQFVSYQGETPDSKTTSVYVSIDNQVIGFFQIQNKYRPGLATVLDWMKDKYRIILLTGDKSREKNTLQSIFPAGAELRFQQTPYDKLMAIKNLQERGEKVLMIGDGLNDAGALRQSDVGITVSENLNNFSPACDAILHADRFKDLPRFLRFSGISMNIIRFNFIISFVYNIIGLSFAVQGTLSPLVSAILMPISSITVIVIATGLTNFFAYLLGFNNSKLIPEMSPLESAPIYSDNLRPLVTSVREVQQ